MSSLSPIILPLTYILVRHEGEGFWGSRIFYEILIPSIASGAITYLYYYTDYSLILIGSGGIFSSVSDLLQLLSAFYLAGLAAIATFGSPAMEQGLRGGNAYIFKWDNEMGRKIPIILSRRAFMTRQFGYLAWMSIILFIIISLFESFQNIPFVFDEIWRDALNIALVFIGLSMFLNIVFVSGSAIVFFISRVNKDEAV